MHQRYKSLKTRLRHDIAGASAVSGSRDSRLTRLFVNIERETSTDEATFEIALIRA